MISSGLPDATVVEAIRFRAGPHLLEGELLYPESAAPWGAAVFADPHPLLGGEMGNNVVRGVTEELAACGLVALRFNYRGVGRSGGPAVDVAGQLARFWQTSHIPDELDLSLDLESAITCLRGIVGSNLPVAAVGYSFGSASLPRVSDTEQLDGFVLIAPTIAKHDYQPYEFVTRPMLVIAPRDDFATKEREVQRWYDRLMAPTELVFTQLDNHFFRGHEAWLAEKIVSFLGNRWRPD